MNAGKVKYNSIRIPEEVSGAIDAGLAEAIVCGAFLFIAQYFVSFSDFLKLRLSLFVPVVAVGVILHGQAPVSLLNVGRTRVFIYTQYFVIIAIAHYLFLPLL